MAAQTYNFEINQGTTFSFAMVFSDAGAGLMPLTTATLAAQIRPTAESQAILQEFTVTKDQIQTGRATFSLTAAQTRNLNFSTAVYDVLVTFADGTALRVAQGSVTLSKQVTR
jgi:hypothetical protein